jgi:hypothetical protein
MTLADRRARIERLEVSNYMRPGALRSPADRAMAADHLLAIFIERAQTIFDHVPLDVELLEAMERDGISGMHGQMLVNWLVSLGRLEPFPDGYLITDEGREQPPFRFPRLEPSSTASPPSEAEFRAGLLRVFLTELREWGAYQLGGSDDAPDAPRLAQLRAHLNKDIQEVEQFTRAAGIRVAVIGPGGDIRNPFASVFSDRTIIQALDDMVEQAISFYVKNPSREPKSTRQRRTTSWKSRWERLRDLGRGGQGRTFVVRERNGDGTERVLKVLNDRNNPDRRARLGREVRALRSFDCDGIPKVIDDNGDFAEPTDELYVVMELVAGLTIEDLVKQHGRRTIDEAVLLTLSLLDIIELCHSRGVVHRDIKPDNCLVREGVGQRVTLIDFGLSVNADEDLLLTETEQQVGNRFLGLPEHRTPGDDKRDHRADLTMCAGMLLYMLTGRQPMTLVDAHGRKPHERPDVYRHFPPGKTEALEQLFGRAFEQRLDQRIQDIEEFRRLLLNLRASASNER